MCRRWKACWVQRGRAEIFRNRTNLGPPCPNAPQLFHNPLCCRVPTADLPNYPDFGRVWPRFDRCCPEFGHLEPALPRNRSKLFTFVRQLTNGPSSTPSVHTLRCEPPTSNVRHYCVHEPCEEERRSGGRSRAARMAVLVRIEGCAGARGHFASRTQKDRHPRPRPPGSRGVHSSRPPECHDRRIDAGDVVYRRRRGAHRRRHMVALCVPLGLRSAVSIFSTMEGSSTRSVDLDLATYAGDTCVGCVWSANLVFGDGPYLSHRAGCVCSAVPA